MLGKGNSHNFGNFDETLTFFQSEIQVPELNPRILWKHLYDDVVNHIPTPIKLEEGLETVRVTEEVIKRSGFKPIQQYHSKA